MQQLPNNELKESYWIYNHRFLLKKVGYGVLYGINGAIIIVLIYSIIVYLIGLPSAKIVDQSLLNTQVLYNNRVKVEALQLLDSGVVQSSPTTVDAYIVVKNPNSLYVAQFDYTITVAGQDIHFTEANIMPNTEAYYLASALPSTSVPNKISGNIDSTNWKRVNKMPISGLDFAVVDITWGAVKLNETMNTNNATTNSSTPVSVVNSAITTASDENSVNASYTGLSATLKNKAIVGFKTVRLVAIIKQEGTIVGIKELTLHDVASYSEIPLLFYWQRRFLTNSDTAIIAYSDYIERDNLIYPGE